MSAAYNKSNIASGSGDPPANNSTISASTGADPELRSRVVGMLSTALNNGFAELGYHPDHLSQVHALHEWNTRLRKDNSELFSDNRKLAQLIEAQNSRLVSSGTSGGNDALALELQRRLQEVELSRHEILRQHERAAHEVTILRAEVNRLSQVLQSKGIPHEVMKIVSSVSGPKLMSQSVVPGYHSGQMQRPRHSQLPPINTSFSAQSAHSAPVHQGHFPAFSVGPQGHTPIVHPMNGGRRSASGPTSAVLLQDPRFSQHAYAESASAAGPSRLSTVSTRSMQTGTPVVDLTGEPDSDEERRAAKKPRLASMPAVPRTAATILAGPSIPRPQSAIASAEPGNRHAQPLTRPAGHADSAPHSRLIPNGNTPVIESKNMQLHSPMQEKSYHVPMDVVQQGQPLGGAPVVSPQPTERARLSERSASISATGISVDEQQAGPSPSAEVIQQCIDENFVDDGHASVGQERQGSSGKRLCRMCQIRSARGLSNKIPEAFPTDTSTEELARHCQEEHPKGWLILLQRCMEDDESDDEE